MNHFEVYYDRPTRSWWGYWMDDEGNQVGDAVNAASRDWVLIYLGMARM